MASENVYQVKSVKVVLKKSLPPYVKVTAKGTVRTTGWTNPRLEQIIYVTPPKDGIQDLNFRADKPSGPSHDTVTDIESDELDMGQVAEWMRGVRVIAETNSTEELF